MLSLISVYDSRRDIVSFRTYILPHFNRDFVSAPVSIVAIAFFDGFADSLLVVLREEFGIGPSLFETILLGGPRGKNLGVRWLSPHRSLGNTS